MCVALGYNVLCFFEFLSPFCVVSWKQHIPLKNVEQHSLPRHIITQKPKKIFATEPLLLVT